MRPKNTPNDPDRRARIVDVTMLLLRDKGVGAVTARSVAGLAGVPVGSVSYYFPSVRALLLEASRQVLRLRASALETWSVDVTADNLERRLAELIHEQLTVGRALTITAYELYILGLRDIEMGKLSADLVSLLHNTIALHRSESEATRLTATVDGYQMQSLFNPTTPDVRAIEKVFRVSIVDDGRRPRRGQV